MNSYCSSDFPQVGPTTAAAVALDTVVLRYRTIRSYDWLPERTRKDLTICLVLRQQIAVADVLQCIDDDDAGNCYY
jgi:hypothetical protein